MKKVRLTRLVGFLTLGFFLVALLLHSLTPHLADRLAPKLIGDLNGFSKPVAREQASLETVLNGSFQASFEKWWAERIPFRTLLIKANNQLDYWLFQHSSMFGGKLHISEQGVLFEYGYVKEFLGFRHLAELEKIKANLQILENAVQYLQNKEIPFVFIISPSKPAIYPEQIPGYFLNAKTGRMRAYDDFAKMLAQTKIPYVDGHALFQENRDKYGISLFPKGGIHWNALGVDMVYEQAMQRLLEQDRAGCLPRFWEKTPYTITDKPQGHDRDLQRLLNLFIHYKHVRYPVAEMAYKIADQQACKKAVVVGTSFSEQILPIVDETLIFPRYAYYNYYTTGRKYCGTRCYLSQFDPASIDWQEEIFNSAAIFLEINESMLNGLKKKNKFIVRFAEDILKYGHLLDQQKSAENSN